MRGQDSLATQDGTTVRHWIRAELANLPEPDAADPEASRKMGETLKSFIARVIRDRVGDPSTKDAFKNQLVIQFSALSEELLPRDETTPLKATALATGLTTLRRVETVKGLKAALTSRFPAARYEGAYALRELHAELEKANLVPDVVGALRAAGVKEEDPVVRAHMYLALSIPGQVSATVDALLAILDARLDAMRKTPMVVGGDGPLPFEYLRAEADRLSAGQPEAVVKRCATFLRLTAAQYAQPGAREFTHDVNLEHTLTAIEALLEKLTRNAGGVRKAMETKDESLGGRILEAAQAWYGAPDKPGVLNADPWRVELGAP